MKRFLTPLLVCFLLITELHSQSLVMTKRKGRGISWAIKEGKQIFVTDVNGVYSKDKFEIVNDSTIKVGTMYYPLENISIIKRKSIGSQVFGGLLIAFGSALLIEGLTDSGEGFLDLKDALLVSGSVTSASGIAFLTVGGKFKKEKWKFSVR